MAPKQAGSTEVTVTEPEIPTPDTAHLNGAGFITREMLEQPLARATVDVYVREFGRKARLQSLTSDETEQFSLDVGKKDGDKLEIDNVHFRTRYIARCWIDPETGERIVKDDEHHLIGRCLPLTVKTLFQAASKLNTLLVSNLEEVADDLGKTPDVAG